MRDVVDLHLLKTAFYSDGNDLHSLASACVRLFAARAEEAQRSGEVVPRSWPPEITAHPHWQSDYRRYADEVQLDLSLENAVVTMNDWIASIDQART